MTKTNRKELTLKIIQYDSYLNWFLGIFFIANPNLLLSYFSPYLQLPFSFWLLLGVGFILFAFWQTFFIIRPNKINSTQLQAAAALAWLPVLALTFFLALIPYVFYPNALLLLWIANIYMLLLGAWYLYVSFNLQQ